MTTIQARRSVAAAALVAAMLAPTRVAHTADDTALFSVNVPPNVMVVIDNSGSMNNMVWHPDFNPAVTYSCTGFTADEAFSTASKSFTKCSKTRTIYSDTKVTAAGNTTRWDKDYLNWIWSLPNGDPRLTEINATGNGTYSTCLQAQGYTTFSKYRRARVTAAKDVLHEVICNINQASAVRFGLAEFRLPGGSNDPNGGYVRVPVNDYNTPSYTLPLASGTLTGTHQQQLDAAINVLEGESWTPLGETLFQIYTYFMSRNAADRPKGVNGTTFPGYVYRTAPSGNYGPYTTTASQIPADPVQFDCQKNFVVIITDGEPTMDTFASSNSSDNTGQGFSSFTGLIGNYNNDGETEVQGTDCVGPASEKCALYLDDIAKFMQKNDFRPDKPGTQVVDVYTVGFTTSPQANDLLSRTAAQGNGLFYHSSNAEELATAIVGAISDIVQKSQSFTAATVPATRTADGGNIYTSLFLPQNNNPFWEGHMKLFNITADGDILDANGNCALVNPMDGCKGGAISQTAPPYWDAGEQIPAPASRSLYTTMPSGSTQVRVPFDTTLPLSALGDPATAVDDLTIADIATYPPSGATTATGLKNAIVQNVRGCEMGTGVTNTCVPRPWLLGDIFHSNPLVVGEPRSFVPEASYHAFANSHATRDKMIYAGANDGFLHAFLGGTWDATPPVGEPPSYDRGTGAETFGFMPWPVRRNIRNLPKDSGSRDFYYVDGSPVAADVWIHNTATQLSTETAKAADGSEWHTVLAGGLRQGGKAYYAIDVTDPSAVDYPQDLWEFPKEGAAAATTSYMGETWGTPILTKVKVVISGVPYERWVAIVTGGYDKTGDPDDPVNYSATATAGRAIFIIDMKTGGILAQKKFNSAASDATSQMRYAIPSTPSVLDLDGDEFADVIYVGDLGGNVWKWVVSYDPAHSNSGEDPINSSGSVDQPNWKFTNFFQAKATTASTLDVTIGAVKYYKSIYFPPAATYNNGSLWLTFATGERANLKRGGDATTTAENNRFYSVVDADPLDRNGPHTAMNESTLCDSTATGTCASLSGFTGYFFRARDSEKFVTNVDIFAYNVLAASYMPTDTSGNPCSSAGNATLYVFRVDTGKGFFTEPDGTPTRSFDLGAGMPTDPRITVSPSGTRVIITQQDGEIENRDGPPIDPEKLGQLYWREVTD